LAGPPVVDASERTLMRQPSPASALTARSQIAPATSSLPGAQSEGVASHCYHCGEPVPTASRWRLRLDHAERAFCCAGCLGVAQTIRAAGLNAFYTRRTGPAESQARVADGSVEAAAAAELAGLVTHRDDGVCEASLLLEGIHCAACVWLSESWLKQQPGVIDASVNFVTRRARVAWDGRRATLADLLRAVTAIGYVAHPYDPRRREALTRRESRALLTRTALALFAMMQVMMFALPAYISADGIAPEQQALLEWASLVLTLPVVLYCAAPFFRGALRDLRLRRLGMDVPVALGVGSAFAASVWASVTGSGAVYYDSVTMFVALLLLARYAELRARQRAGDAIEAIARDLPATAERLVQYPQSMRADTVSAATLAQGDAIHVPAGAVIAADGVVLEGSSSVEEAVMTGESLPVARRPGNAVLAGSINRDSPLIVRVTAAGAATRLAGIVRLVERAAELRPRVARTADRIAGWFVALLLVVAAAAALVWSRYDPAHALAITFAVLVVSCPCALSLATPAALSLMAGALARRQILPVRADALEALARVTHVVFDKTGTLTKGKFALSRAQPLGAMAEADCLALAAALEQGNAHPIARALRAAALPEKVARNVVAIAGCGVEGVIAGTRYRLGRLEWVEAMHSLPLPAAATAIESEATLVALASSRGWLALFTLGDTLRPGAMHAVAALQGLGLHLAILSGDREPTVQRLARMLGIGEAHGGALPESKLAFIAALQRQGAVVAMVGDGVNDAPSLAQADVSIAFGEAAALTQWTADIVVLGADLGRVAVAIAEARRGFAVIRQNLWWALAYNAIAIPLAAAGHLTPLAAALGMSLSSLLVVGNALRLGRPRSDERSGTAARVTALPASA